MRTFVTVVLCVIASSICCAQGASRNEFGLGFSFVHGHLSAEDKTSTFPGIQFDYTRNVNRWVGFTGEYTGHFHCLKACSWNESLAREKAHVFAVGPKFVFGNQSKITPWAHVLAGVANVSTSDDILETKDSTTGWALVAGGGLDYRLAGASIRIIQVDLLRHPAGSHTRNDLRFGFGASFGWGSTERKRK